ncbi:hypothetical protein BJ878DRAFT_54001 [Calycina marina]|uniref:Ubiquitin-like-conjugating enzyme ATG10 n=1 Tax=Calycina marina TaxID=1763456 RepID=A0A9P7ZAN4_9HELO|nr:hypothetical protein BJ878DRAFT_54001 [Calycina marina]
MSHRDEYKQWPFLTEEEFELACALFDKKYVQAKMGPTRQIFKIRVRRTMTTGVTYVEILRLLKLPENNLDLLDAFGKMKASEEEAATDADMMDENTDEEALRTTNQQDDGLPQYTTYARQPYVTYEIHLHPTYRTPTLWFTLHDLPMGEPTFNLDSVYRYLVPPEYKSGLRAAGITGGISAALNPVTDIPAFFIHPCQTGEAMEKLDCSIDNYLMMWIGLVGGCVGLWVPKEMAQAEKSGSIVIR